MIRDENDMKPDGSQVFHVTEADAGATLASLLRNRLPDLSWNQVRKAIHGRRVLIHGNLCLDEGRRVKAGEVVKWLAQAQQAPPRDDDVRIVYLDAHVAVVEKPAGMTTLRHSEERFWPDRRKQRQPTLDEVLSRLLALRAGERGGRSGRRDRDSDQKRPRTLPVRPVHRLDRETSGLMVFARTVIAERGLVQQFRKHSIHRAYVAVVHGKVHEQTIDVRLVRDRGDGRRGGTKSAQAGQRAVTHVRPLEALKGYTVVACRLETGRTHQIRIHLSEQGHFVCGDKVYCQPLFQKPLPDRSGAPRLALHAAELGFVHPVSGEVLRFNMPLPPDLQKLLDHLRQAAGSTLKGSPLVPADGWPIRPEHELPDEGSDEDEEGNLTGFLPPPEPEPSEHGPGRKKRPQHPLEDLRPDTKAPRPRRPRPNSSGDSPPAHGKSRRRKRRN